MFVKEIKFVLEFDCENLLSFFIFDEVVFFLIEEGFDFIVISIELVINLLFCLFCIYNNGFKRLLNILFLL